MTLIADKINIREYIKYPWTEAEQAQHREAFKQYLRMATESSCTGNLRKDYDGSPVRYCALGLAGKMMGLYDDNGYKVFFDNEDSFSDMTEACYQAIRNWLGFEQALGYFTDRRSFERSSHFAGAFDACVNFQQVAELVDEVEVTQAFSWRKRG